MLSALSRRSFLSLPMAAAAAGPARPNVIILLADDLGWADVGYHGSEISTPNLDRLAGEGVRLEQFYSCPVCSPTRSALMTGRSAIRFGVQYTVIRPWARYAVPASEHFMSESFRAAGYETAIAGKWHLGHHEAKFFPGARGFDHSYGHFNGAIDYYTHVREGGIDWHRNGRTLEEPGYSTELIGSEAVRRIRERDKSRPLFLYVPFNAPHTPLQAPQALIARYAKIEDGKRRTFAAMVDAMDAQVGRILGAVDDAGIRDSTIVLFFSDNGGPTDAGARNTPLRGKKGTTYEGGTRVPAILRWPGKVRAGSRTMQVLAAHDVFPTLAAAAGVKPLNKLPLDGKNYWPQLQAGNESPHDDLFLAVHAGGTTYYSVRSGPWKLVRESSGGSDRNLLFQIGNDPNEAKDLAAQKASIVKDLSAKLETWRALQPSHGLFSMDTPPAGWTAPKRWADEAAR